MKKIILSLLALFCSAAYGQTVTKLGATEQKLNDMLCECVSKLDLSKISGKTQGIKAYTDCIAQHTDVLMKLAAERKIDFNDEEGMSTLGIEIAKNLLTENCVAASQLGVRMNEEPADALIGVTQGTFKRVDLKGFNYIVITDANKTEKSFLWLSQFPDSEKFMGSPAGLTGKKLSIKWKEIEVYLPEAKGYYKVKEIIEVTVL